MLPLGRSVGSRQELQLASWGARLPSGATVMAGHSLGGPPAARLLTRGASQPALPTTPLPLASALCLMFVTSTPSALRGWAWQGPLLCREMSWVREGPGGGRESITYSIFIENRVALAFSCCPSWWERVGWRAQGFTSLSFGRMCQGAFHTTVSLVPAVWQTAFSVSRSTREGDALFLKELLTV